MFIKLCAGKLDHDLNYIKVTHEACQVEGCHSDVSRNIYWKLRLDQQFDYHRVVLHARQMQDVDSITIGCQDINTFVR